MKLSEMFPSRYLAPQDLRGREVPVIIRGVEYDEMRDPRSGKRISKPVVYFEKKTKGLVLNKTNAFAIGEIVGSEDTRDWLGREIVLYPTRTIVAGTERDCVRVKPLLDDAKEES